MAPSKQLFIISTFVNVLMCTGARSLLFTAVTLEDNETAQKAIQYSVNQA
jgi:hypothetical protein